MRRPLIILCLSDLHYLPNTIGAEALSKIELGTNTTSNSLSPDYIVVAGDIIVYSDKQNKRSERYKSVGTFLNKLVVAYGIDKNKIIIVPGNHDKVCCKNEQKLINSLQNFCQPRPVVKNTSWISKLLRHFRLTKSPENVFDYEKNFGEQFKDFAEFYSCYFDNDNDNYFSPIEKTSEHGDYLRKTIGIKFFDEDKICFVTINTEITYTPKNTKNPDVLRLVPQLVNRIIEKLANSKYANYRVVTVMHRNPNEFSFAEINEWSSLDYIYNWSDIILTGHNHPDRCQTPHLMANHAQLFKLGAASLNDRSNSRLSSYNALILKVDTSINKLEYYYLKNTLIKRNNFWQTDLHNEVILKDSRYVLDKSNKAVNSLGIPYLDANDTLDDLKKAAKRCFQINDANHLFVRPINSVGVKISTICNEILERKPKCTQQDEPEMLYVVFVYKSYSFKETPLLKQIMKNNSELAKCIVKMQVVVMEALLRTPFLPYRKIN